MDGLMLAIAVLGGWIASVCLHEFGHAIVAYYGGDTTVKDKGYLTLNPLKYTNIGYSLVLPIVFLMMGGIALPGAAVYINTSLLRSRCWNSAVSAAGPLATGLVAIILSLPFLLRFPNNDSWTWHALALLAFLQISSFFFNLIPIPPFDGFGILSPWLPKPIQEGAHRFGNYGYLALMALFWTDPSFNQMFWGLVSTVSIGLGIPASTVQTAYRDFASSGKILFCVGLVAVVIYRKVVPPKAQVISEPNELDPLAAYDRAIETQPASPQTWLERGQVLSSLGRYEEAITSYDEALKDTNPKDTNSKNVSPKDAINNATAWYKRAIALHHLARYDEALTSYDHTLTLQPDHSDAWSNKAGVLIGLQRDEEAVAAYDQSLKHQPASFQGWYDRGKALYRLQRYPEALTSFERASLDQRNNPQLWIDYAATLAQLGQPQAALINYRHAVRLDPDNIAIRRTQGNLSLQLGFEKRALSSYNAALKCNPHDSATLLLRGLTLFNLGRLQTAQTDFELIQTLLQDAIEQPTQTTEAYSLSADWTMLGPRFEALLAHPPSPTCIGMAQGLILTTLNRSEEALTVYDQTLEQNSPTVEVCYLKAQLLIQRKDYEAAIAAFDRALDLNPNLYQLWYGRGCICNKATQLHEALRCFERAEQIYTESPLLWFEKGFSWFYLQEHELAIAAFDQCLQLKGDEPSSHYNKACSYALLGQPELALKSLKDAFQTGSQSLRADAKVDPDLRSLYHLESFQQLTALSK